MKENNRENEKLAWTKPELIESVLSSTEGKDSANPTEINIHMAPS